MFGNNVNGTTACGTKLSPHTRMKKSISRTFLLGSFNTADKFWAGNCVHFLPVLTKVSSLYLTTANEGKESFLSSLVFSFSRSIFLNFVARPTNQYIKSLLYV